MRLPARSWKATLRKLGLVIREAWGGGRRFRKPTRHPAVEALEPRTVMSVEVVTPLGNKTLGEDFEETAIDLRPYFRSDKTESLDFSIQSQSGNTSIITADIHGYALHLKAEPNKHGTIDIQIKAQ